MTDVDDYLAVAPDPQRSTLTQLRATLRQLLPEATESLSYGMPAFKVKGKAIAGYAYFKNHCSFFPHSGTVLPALAEDLGGYEWTKGTLKFPVDQPLPEPLVVKVVEERLRQLGLR